MRFVLLLTVLAAVLAGSRSASPAAQAAMRNAALANIPDNTWVRLNVTMPPNRKGGAEVFWAHDPVNRVVVHYGGCTSPYTNEQWNFDLGTETWTLKYPHNLAAPANLPGGGCSRGLAFDSRRGRVWINGGASNGGIGAGGTGLFYYAAATNTWTKAVENWGVRGRFDGTRQEASCVGYDSVNDLLVSIGRVPAGVGDVWVYDIQNQIWNARSYDPVVNGTGYVPVTFDPDIAQFVFFNGSSTWTYNARTDVWTRKVTSAQPPGGRNHVGMAYDSRNKVHILYGGRGGANDTWVYNARMNTWTEMRPSQHPQNGIDTLLFSYDPEHNVSVLSDYRPGSPLWVYRYSNSGTPPPPPPADTTPPTVTITTPTSASTSATSSTPIALGGTASDNVGVTQVTWSNAATGGTGTAAGTTPWTASVPLASGSNAITVTARDAAGSVGSDTITVTYSPPASGDTDNDGLPDAWEMPHFGGLNQTGSGDPDGDGATNAQEYAAGTDPMDPASVPGGGGSTGGTPPPSTGGSEGENGDHSINDALCGALGAEALLALGALGGLARRRRPR